MKAVINEKETLVKEKEYPWIGKFINTEGKAIIVGFKSHRNGTVIYSNSNVWNVFETCSIWDETNFTPFTGSITLSND
jgi:hypothetical protein